MASKKKTDANKAKSGSVADESPPSLHVEKSNTPSKQQADIATTAGSSSGSSANMSSKVKKQNNSTAGGTYKIPKKQNNDDEMKALLTGIAKDVNNVTNKVNTMWTDMYELHEEIDNDYSPSKWLRNCPGNRITLLS